MMKEITVNNSDEFQELVDNKDFSNREFYYITGSD